MGQVKSSKTKDLNEIRGSRLDTENRDRILINKIAKRDESAFEEFLKYYQHRIINLLYRYTHSRSDAEELAQDVFINIWNRADSFKGRSRVSTWIYRIACNLAINHLKKRKLPILSIDGYITSPSSRIKKDLIDPGALRSESFTDNKEKKALIEAAIEKLSPAQKMAILLSRYEGYSYAEISEIMKISVSAVESLLFKAKQKLRTILLPFKEKGML